MGADVHVILVACHPHLDEVHARDVSPSLTVDDGDVVVSTVTCVGTQTIHKTTTLVLTKEAVDTYFLE